MQNITLEGDTTNDPAFTNILDTKQSEDIVNNPTRASYYAVLSHQQGATEINLLDSRWVIRTELAHGNSLTVGDKFRTWINDIYVSGVRQDPSAIGLDYTYVNNTEHTIADIWNGWVDVRLTNQNL